MSNQIYTLWDPSNKWLKGNKEMKYCMKLIAKTPKIKLSLYEFLFLKATALTRQASLKFFNAPDR